MTNILFWALLFVAAVLLFILGARWKNAEDKYLWDVAMADYERDFRSFTRSIETKDAYLKREFGIGI